MTRIFMLLGLTALLSGCGLSADGTQESSLTTPMIMTALNAVGIQVAALPETGCSGSVIPPEKLVELVNAVPPEQQAVLAQVLTMSSTAWATQLYHGEYGVGLCFPIEQVLLVMPAGWTAG